MSFKALINSSENYDLCVDNIVDNRDVRGFMDIGTGISTTFNGLVRIINRKLGTDIKPKYNEKPSLYVENTICKTPCKCKISLEEGIERIINE